MQTTIKLKPKILLDNHDTKPSINKDEYDEHDDEHDEHEQSDYQDSSDNDQDELDDDRMSSPNNSEVSKLSIGTAVTETGNKRKPRTQKIYPPSDAMFTELIKQMNDLRNASRKVINLSREVQKCVGKEIRELRNQIKKHKGEKPQRKPRGFALPALISNQMVTYLQETAKVTEIERKVDGVVVGKIPIEYGCCLARNELSRALNQHFESAGMRKCDTDHRKIYLDPKTQTLLKIDPEKHKLEGGPMSDDGEPIITYFELSKYLGQHCGKKAVGH